MSPGWAGGLLALALAAPGEASAAGRITIAHDPVECVPYDLYTRIAATGAPANGVATAQLQFRSEGERDWYSVGMTVHGAEWSAFLPRPARPLASFEYRIVMRAVDSHETATPAVAVPVRGEAECASPARSSAEVAAPIVVRVPAGAPLVPPVPAGFSPAGVVAAAERARTSILPVLAVAAGVAGGGAAAVLAARAEPPAIDDFPEFEFAGTTPVPGSILSLSRDQMSVFMLLRGRARIPFNFGWSFEMLGVGGSTPCVHLTGTASVSSALPATVTLTGPFNLTGACGERFDVDRSFLRVLIDNRTVFQSFHPALPFHFEP